LFLTYHYADNNGILKSNIGSIATTMLSA